MFRRQTGLSEERRSALLYSEPLSVGHALRSRGLPQVTPPEDITQILQEVSGGNREAPARLMPLVYDELRRLADHYLRRERPDHTLQPTALVHEAYLKLIDQTRVDWQNRAHFFGVAAQLMRRILVDHARRHQAEKRGGFRQKLTLDEAVDYSRTRDVDLVKLDDALTALAQFDARQSRVVELRFFGGLTIEETAEALSVSPATVKVDWSMAKAWLRREIGGGDDTDGDVA
jgi:RNA polymerase sigma-70 factor (ECF subfamily)